MSELRVHGRSEDGQSLVLHGMDGEQFSLKITDHLKSLVNQPRLTSISTNETAGSEGITIREIQSRLRAGESMESIVSTGGVSEEKVERYSAPILQERSYIISLAQKVVTKKSGPTLFEIVESKLAPRGVDMRSIEWNTFRNENGSWHISLSYPTSTGGESARWEFDLTKKSIRSTDNGARWIMGEEISVKDELKEKVRPIHQEESAPPRLVAIRTNPVDLVKEHMEILEDESHPDKDSSDLNQLDFDGDDIDSLVDGEIASDARKDGVVKRVSIPSWDDIMFGVRKEKSEDSD
jgi:hypothetical protein